MMKVPRELALELAPGVFHSAALENMGGGRLAGAGAGAERAEESVNVFFPRSDMRIRLTEEVPRASEDARQRTLVLARSRPDSVGRNHGFLAASSTRPDAVVSQHGTVAARQTLHADPLLHEPRAVGERGVGHGVGDDSCDVRRGHGGAGEDVDDVGRADPGGDDVLAWRVDVDALAAVAELAHVAGDADAADDDGWAVGTACGSWRAGAGVGAGISCGDDDVHAGFDGCVKGLVDGVDFAGRSEGH